MAKTIKIVIPKNNPLAVQISVACVKGESCKDLTKRLEDRLGVVVADTETPEFYEPPEMEVEGQREFE